MNFKQKLPLLIISATLLNVFHSISQISSQNTTHHMQESDSSLHVIDETIKINETKLDSVTDKNLSQAIHVLISESGAIYTDLLSIRSEIGQTESILKASELYLAIQANDINSKIVLDLKKSIRKRAYVSMGIGLASSALFFIGNNKGSGGKSTRNIGAVVSLTIPIVSLITMNKQLKSIQVPPSYDEEIFTNHGILVDIHSLNFNKNLIKTELNLLKLLIGRIDNANATNLMKLKAAHTDQTLKACIATSLKVHKQLVYAGFQIERLNKLLKDKQYVIGFDQSAISKFKMLEKELDMFTENWNRYGNTLDLINKRLADFMY